MKRGFVVVRLTVLAGLLVAAMVTPDSEAERDIPARAEVGQTLPSDSSATCYTVRHEMIVCPQRTGS